MRNNKIQKKTYELKLKNTNLEVKAIYVESWGHEFFEFFVGRNTLDCFPFESFKTSDDLISLLIENALMFLNKEIKNLCEVETQLRNKKNLLENISYKGIEININDLENRGN